jgi:hypothetical protein
LTEIFNIKFINLKQTDSTEISSFAGINKSDETIFFNLFKIPCDDNQPSNWKQFCRLSCLIMSLVDKVNLDEESTDHEILNITTNSIQKCLILGLEPLIKKQSDQITFGVTDLDHDEYLRLTSCLRITRKFYKLNFIKTNPLFDDSKLDYFIGILAVVSMKRNDEDFKEFKQFLLDSNEIIHSKEKFRFLMMCKGFKGFSKEFQLLVHQELMKMIRSENGIYLLCKNLLVKKDERIPIWQRFPMITKIVESAITNSSRIFMINEIFRTLEIAYNTNDMDSVGACVHLIKSLETEQDLKVLIRDKIFDGIFQLSQPEVILTGSILKDSQELSRDISRLHMLFSNSTVSSLPSSILNDSIFIIFDLFTILPSDETCKGKLRNILIYYLINRPKSEMKNIIRNMRLKDDKSKARLHPRIIFKNSSLQIGANQEGLTDDTENFLDLVKNSNNNFLIFDVFYNLISIFGDIQDSGENFLSEYDVDEELLPEVLHKKFFKKLSILEPLQEMISWKSLQSQLNEKSNEILVAIKDILCKFFEKPSSLDEHIFIIFLAIYKELASKIVEEEKKKLAFNEIEAIKLKCKNQKLKEKISLMFNEEKSVKIDPSNSTYDDAMELLKSKEVFLKVYGIDLLMKLVKKRDEKTLVNRHVILASALQHLKSEDSYAFLNIIRLLVALSYHMESEVIDTLITEYKNQESDIDERLKFGEIIIKIIENLGIMAIKFKQQLIKCFVIGSSDVNNEFRTSSLVNLGNVCKILSYQVHNIFYEIFQQIEIIVKSDDYLPSKRAAVMVLSQILSNLPNLMDFENYLLPIYHLLKYVMSNETDQQTRIHAEIALDHLNSKTKEFLNPKLDNQKEIKIRLDKDPHLIDEIKFK